MTVLSDWTPPSENLGTVAVQAFTWERRWRED